MTLVKSALQASIKTALESAKTNNWSVDQVAAAWADAIHNYVKEAEVQGLESSVTVSVPLTGPSPATGSGTATQSAAVKVQ